jgi:thermostable 8-oxoguanine DNA glycosylase
VIDPYDLTKPWDDDRLQEWFLFGVCVAGKSARQTAEKVDAFLNHSGSVHNGDTPFSIVSRMIRDRKLRYNLKKHRLGQYDRISKAMRGMIKIDPETVTLEELEQIHGVGAKTARMLLLYTRPDQEMIPLDTHVLKWLRAQGYDAPKSTPAPGKKYRELELAFIREGKDESRMFVTPGASRAVGANARLADFSQRALDGGPELLQLAEEMPVEV